MKSEMQALADTFLNHEKFSNEVEKLVENKHYTYAEAILAVCVAKDIDFEDLPKLKLISPLLKSKLQAEGEANGLLKAESKLPF